MAGGNLMDNFLDKLAQKWNAQEIIKANTIAEQEEVDQLCKQVKKYEECLDKMKNICKEMEEISGKIGQHFQESSKQMEERLLASSEQVEKQIKEVTAQMEQELRENASGLEKILKERIEHLSGGSLDQVQESVTDLSAHVDDVIHTENVKVYRNVQAVVTDETSKATESIQGMVDKLEGKISPILGISILALIAAVSGLTFQLLIYFGIL